MICPRGLSPRLRGNLPPLDRPVDHLGSIPAPAGEPPHHTFGSSFMKVYPRACGGTTLPPFRKGCRKGLSPRLRGNLAFPRLKLNPSGSIPAPAGEPRPRRGSRPGSRVYPRACGGTIMVQAEDRLHRGLSPRLRGNPTICRGNPAASRSIPAPAGEPTSPVHTGSSAWVYPRACGGTVPGAAAAASVTGLSPRLRGNRGRDRRLGLRPGSIPAPAGEPLLQTASRPPCGVYPRACGGTAGLDGGAWVCMGLSPRLRGNRVHPVDAVGIEGSIPAPAGEPWPFLRSRPLPRVYPRACGGTTTIALASPSPSGLSPRLRGNPKRWRGC